jgi:hypothetical protein
MFPDVGCCSTPSEYAFAYAEAGISVFPVMLVEAGGKMQKRPHWMLAGAPRGEGGFRLASSDVVVVNGWWLRDPSAWIGWWPGAVSAVVIDADGPAGVRALFDVSRGELDRSTTVQIHTSGKGGGRHVVFDRSTIDGAIGNGSLIGLPGECRADAGYGMLPDGRDYYRFDSTTRLLAPIPTWAVALLPVGAKHNRASIAGVGGAEEETWMQTHSARRNSKAGQAVVDGAVYAIAAATAGDRKMGRHPTMNSVVGGIVSYAQGRPRGCDLAGARRRLGEVFVAQFDEHVRDAAADDFERFWRDAVAVRAVEDRASNT